MGIEELKSRKWPMALRRGDDLYTVTDLDTDEVEYLVYSSSEKQSTFIRENRAWIKVSEKFFDEIDDPKYSIEFFGNVGVIDKFDNSHAERISPMYSRNFMPTTAVTAAADEEFVCPPATQDIAMNLKNRSRAIQVADYGPLNPAEKNIDFWQQKADNWKIKPEEAKKSLCGNCVFFIRTSKMLDCISSGIEQGGSAKKDAWDAIDTAELGFCEAFDFKCAASRTCDAWVTGGPIVDNVESNGGVK